MTRLNIALLALLPGALAVPRLHNRHEKHHRSYGVYPTGAPVAPTGGPTAPYGYGNATSNGPTGTGTGSPVIYSTVTVSPVPVSSDGAISGGAGGYGGNGGGSSYGAGSISAVNGNSPVSGGAGTGACGPATVTVTSANTVTVTVGAGGAAGSSNAATSNNNAASNSPISPVSTGSVAPYGNGTSTAPTGTGTAPVGTASRGTGIPKYSGLPVYSGKPASSSSSTEALSPVSVAPVSTAAPASTSTTSLSAYSAPAASPYVAPVAESSNAAVSATSSTSSTPVAAFYQKPSQASSQAPSVPASSPIAASPVVQSSSSSSSASASATAATAPSSGNVKARGLAYQNAGLTDLFQTSAVGWGYNWGQTAGSLASGVQFVPMLHDNQDSSFANWASNAQKAIASGSTHLLAFNEPEQPTSAGGCQMSVQQVIDGWNAHMAPFKGKAKLGSPAVTSQEGSQTAGLPLLSQYLSSFGADVDFICIHWYGTEFSQFKQHISDAQKVAGGKPIWLTEFAHNDPAQAASFMAQALPWLDNPANGVERYAYQFVDTTLTNGQSLSAAGQVYDGKA